MRFVAPALRHATVGVTALVITAGLVAVATPAADAGMVSRAPFPRFVSVPLTSVVIGQHVTRIDRGAGGSYHVFAPSPQTHRCVRMDADSDTVGRNGGKVQTWGCNGSHNQNWAFDSTDVTGLYQIRTGVNGRCLDADNSGDAGNGTRIQVWDCLGVGQLNQFFWLVQNGGVLRLVSNIGANYRSVLADDTWPDGGEIVLWDTLATDQQQWMLEAI
jgi:hypothetical protein